MPLWLLLLIFCGGLLIFGVLFDWAAKKKNIQTDFSEGAKHASEEERIYIEKALDDAKQQIRNDYDWQ